MGSEMCIRDSFICLAQVLFTEPDIKAASEEEKIIDVPTYPKYNIGGWIANAGSWSIGFKPVPSFGIGNKLINGFEVKRINNKNPAIIISWKNKVRILYLFERFFEVIVKINKKIDNTNNQRSKLPSWFPPVPEIL